MNIKLASDIKAKIDTLDTVVDALTGKISLGGSGADGAKTVASSENIAPDTIFNHTTLTVNSGQTLGLTGVGKMLLVCNDIISISGVISVNGLGSIGGAGAVGTPGNAGVAENNGGCVSGGGAGGGSPAGGGIGGDGGASTDDHCGAGGAGRANNIGLPGVIASQEGIAMYQSSVNTKTIVNLGPGGGGGSGDGANDGGNGGAGGGVIFIIAPEVRIETGGSITAHGIAGSNITVGNGGGGGGGAGGNIVILTKKFTNNGTMTVTAGIGGTAAGTGHAGGNGAVGNIVVMLV